MIATELFRRRGMDVLIRNVVKTYTSGDTRFSALDDVSCDMKQGQVTIIEGPSGCGKSTLLNMLGAIDRADRGSISVGEHDLTQSTRERDLASYRLRHVGFVFQAFNLIPGLSAMDNLRLPMSVAGTPHAEIASRGRALLELVGLAERAAKRPDELSGGEQQRVATALALVNDPPLILADEPTGNLDTRNTAMVADLLRSLAHDTGKTVIIATHDPAVASRGDVVFQMRDGVFVR